MSRFPAPITACLMDRKGNIHGTHDFYDKNPQRAVDHDFLNPNVRVATKGRYQYTLADPKADDFLTHIEKLFGTT